MLNISQMIVKAKKYGNSHVFPIPKAIFDLFGVTDGKKFELQADKNGFFFKPIVENDQLIEQALNESVEEHKDLLNILAQ